jgi:DNA-binding beta-propeller fold protein YncE
MPEALGECLFFRKPGIQTRPNVFCFWLGRATVARQTEGYLARTFLLSTSPRRINMRTARPIVVALALVLFIVAPVLAQSEWTVTKTLHVGGEGGWDYLTVDPQTHRLYVPRSTHTMVIDSESGNTIADIPGQKRAHGVAIVPQAGRGFISDGGGDGAVVIFDLRTNAVLGTIAAQVLSG